MRNEDTKHKCGFLHLKVKPTVGPWKHPEGLCGGSTDQSARWRQDPHYLTWNQDDLWNIWSRSQHDIFTFPPVRRLICLSSGWWSRGCLDQWRLQQRRTEVWRCCRSQHHVEDLHPEDVKKSTTSPWTELQSVLMKWNMTITDQSESLPGLHCWCCWRIWWRRREQHLQDPPGQKTTMWTWKQTHQHCRTTLLLHLISFDLKLKVTFCTYRCSEINTYLKCDLNVDVVSGSHHLLRVFPESLWSSFESSFLPELCLLLLINVIHSIS